MQHTIFCIEDKVRLIVVDRRSFSRAVILETTSAMLDAFSSGAKFSCAAFSTAPVQYRLHVSVRFCSDAVLTYTPTRAKLSSSDSRSVR
eukprot:4434620-Amphidinium_carterae.2